MNHGAVRVFHRHQDLADAIALARGDFIGRSRIGTGTPTAPTDPPKYGFPIRESRSEMSAACLFYPPSTSETFMTSQVTLVLSSKRGEDIGAVKGSNLRTWKKMKPSSGAGGLHLIAISAFMRPHSHRSDHDSR